MADPPPPYAQNQPLPPGMYPNMAGPQMVGGYGQPYPQAGPMPQVTQVIVTSGFGPHSMAAHCPNCNQQVCLTLTALRISYQNCPFEKQVITRTEPVTGLLTWILSGTLLVMGCFFGW